MLFFQSSAYFTKVKWLILKKTIIFQSFQAGSTIFQGGGGGSNCLFPKETHIICDFPGGVPDPLSPPLDPHLISQMFFMMPSTKITQNGFIPPNEAATRALDKKCLRKIYEPLVQIQYSVTDCTTTSCRSSLYHYLVPQLIIPLHHVTARCTAT